MIKRIQNQKGASLIELIISLSLLLIIGLGVSALILNLINYQSITQKKREATVLGQNILEEFATIDQITDEMIEFKNMAPLKKDPTTGVYTQLYGIYQVEMNLEKELAFDEDQEETEAVVFELERKPVERTLVINKSEDNKYIFEMGTTSRKESNDPKASFLIKEEIESDQSLIQVDNRTSDWITIEMKYQEDSLSKIKCDSNEKVRVVHLYNNHDVEEEQKPLDFYHFTLTISSEGKELFKSYGNQFLTIEEEPDNATQKKGI